MSLIGANSSSGTSEYANPLYLDQDHFFSVLNMGSFSGTPLSQGIPEPVDGRSVAVVAGASLLFGDEFHLLPHRQLHFQIGIHADFSRCLVALQICITRTGDGAIGHLAVTGYVRRFDHIAIFWWWNGITQEHFPDFQSPANGSFVVGVVGQKSESRQQSMAMRSGKVLGNRTRLISGLCIELSLLRTGGIGLIDAPRLIFPAWMDRLPAPEHLQVWPI